MRYEATLCNSVVWIGLLLLLLRWYWGAALLIILTLCGFTARHGPVRGSSAFWHVVGYSTLFGGCVWRMVCSSASVCPDMMPLGGQASQHEVAQRRGHSLSRPGSCVDAAGELPHSACHP